MSKSSKTLFNLKEFNDLHHNKKMSLYEIAEKYNTYPNKIRRLAQKLGAKIRSKSEAQKIALQTGRQVHPTKGKTRTEDVKIKISDSVAEIWENMEEEERERRSNISREHWNNRSPTEQIEFQQKASQGIRKAAKHGSKLEIQITKFLIEKGYKITFHKQHMVGSEKMHLDIVINNLLTAIEIDGPSHFQPIWGEKKLKKSQNADQRKDGLLLAGGYSIIRIKQKKDLTKKLVRDIIYELEKVLFRIENKKDRRRGTRKFVIGE